MQDTFEIARGSVAGHDHVRAGRNNQDGLAVVQTPQLTVAVVCDGCSSGRHSEAGAQFGARLLAHTIRRFMGTRACWMTDLSADPFDWPKIQRSCLWQMREWVHSLGAVDSEDRVSTSFVNDYLLFTAVCAVITPERTEFAAFGDGCISVNGKTSFMGPFEGNAPPYLAYGLVPSSMPAERQKFVVHRAMPTKDLNSFMIGTDGVSSLDNAERKQFPGKTKEVGPLRQLWEDDRFFRNQDAGRRHLVLANGGVGSRLPGLLEDDTTFVSGRRTALA